MVRLPLDVRKEQRVKIERIRELNETLTKVLADPQPGHITWCSWLHATMQSICSEWQTTTSAAEVPASDVEGYGYVCAPASDEDVRKAFRRMRETEES
jgi:hypothetical protein